MWTQPQLHLVKTNMSWKVFPLKKTTANFKLTECSLALIKELEPRAAFSPQFCKEKLHFGALPSMLIDQRMSMGGLS